MRITGAEIGRRWFAEVWNQASDSTIEELMHPRAQGHTHAGVIHSRQEWKERIWDPLMAAFSNIRIEVEDTVAEGDNVAIRWHATMDHTGAGLGVPPTGKSVEFSGMTWMVVKDGQNVRGWDGWDSTALLVACGCNVG